MIFYSHYKKIRRERKIALEDISKRTKIDVIYLKFIESGKFAEIPAIYIKLFFKAYINKIGCDIDEALDAVDTDKVEPHDDFEDREDKDIDNDGDTDDSDEYLHKKRQAITKAVKKESKSLKDVGGVVNIPSLGAMIKGK